ncbi:kazal-type serine protease inhibitor domain-containing protein 1-like [Mixophyes fleayi]|uniref:kazal-type serine protease inhibitor domain-containing protein 1-like n=1 Tax=Mixophyes fleayi TaxID=3061075 RepID=UPI003F4DDC51
MPPTLHCLLLASWLLSFLSPALPRLVPKEKCPPCQEESCLPAPQRCPAGRVRDQCGCCWQCANVEGQMCDLSWERHHFGTCGEELQCRVKLGHSEEPQCVCPTQDSVCGTDRRTYKNICRFQEAVRMRRRTVLGLAHTGPCQEAPVLLSAPRDMVAVVGHSVILGCEVSAQPVAELEWTKDGTKRPVQGDNRNVIVQSRGGPQRHQVTGWLQINHVTQRDAGLYTCQAWNIFGQVSSSARLHVITPDSPLASEVFQHLVGVFDVTDDEDDSVREGSSGSHE